MAIFLWLLSFCWGLPLSLSFFYIFQHIFCLFLGTTAPIGPKFSVFCLQFISFNLNPLNLKTAMFFLNLVKLTEKTIPIYENVFSSVRGCSACHDIFKIYQPKRGFEMKETFCTAPIGLIFSVRLVLFDTGCHTPNFSFEGWRMPKIIEWFAWRAKWSLWYASELM